MFCRKCGYKLQDDARFCPACGEEVIMNVADSGNDNASEDFASETSRIEPENTVIVPVDNSDDSGKSKSEKINWKEFLTMDNIERFAPISSLVPLAMAVIVGIIGGILLATVGTFPVGRTICKIVLFILKALFIIATGASTGGLIYVAINRKDTSKVITWVVPLVSLLAFISCLGIAFKWTAVAWIFGIISVILGLEFLARIVIAQMPMDSAINPDGALNTYKQYYKNYKAKYPSTSDLEKAGIEDPENSKFDGSGLELFGYRLLLVLVSLVTCGIATPWMLCTIYRWRISHTVINGKRLTFTGSGGSLLGHWILWEILTAITCGIYGFFVHVALRKWELNHTYIEGEAIIANANESFFDGGSFEYFGYALLGGLLLLITCGLAYPWVMAIIQKWDTKHQVINRRRLVFSGSGLGFLGEYLLILIFTVITLGIYAPWGTVRMNKYIIRNTDFVAPIQ